MDIAGSAAIVTGGASGLGAATARKLANAGMSVVVIDLQDDLGEQVATEVGGAFVHADVTKPDDVQAAVDTASEIAPLRVLINCAGIGPPQRTINRDGTPHDLEQFAMLININLIGTFNCIRLAAAAMVATEPMADNERGAIVNTASVAALTARSDKRPIRLPKGGIVGMTLPIARDLASSGVRVNTIAPGIIDTPLLAGLPEPARLSLSQQVLHPKRLGMPDEYAALAHHLVTHSYMNGETIRMDGGIRMGPK